MRLLYPAIISLICVFVQGCSSVLYIPPANSQMSKSQLVLVNRFYQPGIAQYIDKVNGVKVAQPVFGEVEQYDFHVVPGTYAIDLSTGETTTVQISPTEIGKTMSDADFLKYGN